MPLTTRTRTHSSPHIERPGRSTLAATVAAVVVVAIAAGAALAVTGDHARASATARVVRAATSSSLGEKVVVDVHGRTLYALSPETAHRLLCKSHACFARWPPLLVHSATVKLAAGAGVGGRLGVVRRGRGKFQVTLRGLPLYRFVGDKAAGEANGDGVKGFGGTWHALAIPSHSPPPHVNPAPAPMSYAY
jgi:predicted lipoprotein with Yx(FWY)xxD motif